MRYIAANGWGKGDGIHLNAAGYGVVANYVAQTITIP
jgi:lysophospholipase L1-like esterase